MSERLQGLVNLPRTLYHVSDHINEGLEVTPLPPPLL